MRQLFLIITLTVICASLGVAQSTTFDQIRLSGQSDLSGWVWTNSLTTYTEFIDMKDVDSAWVVVNFPDSMCAAFYVENYSSRDGVANIILNAPAGTGAADSLVSTANGGYSHSFTLTTWYDTGYPLIRIKTIHSSSKNHATTGADYLGTKCKYYIKRFRHK